MSSQSKPVLLTVINAQAGDTAHNAMMVSCFLEEGAINASLAVPSVQIISTFVLDAQMVTCFLEENAIHALLAVPSAQVISTSALSVLMVICSLVGSAIRALILTAPYVQIMSAPALSVLAATKFPREGATLLLQISSLNDPMIVDICIFAQLHFQKLIHFHLKPRILSFSER